MQLAHVFPEDILHFLHLFLRLLHFAFIFIPLRVVVSEIFEFGLVDHLS